MKKMSFLVLLVAVVLVAAASALAAIKVTQVFTAQTANGNSSAYQLTSAPEGGVQPVTMQLQASGTWGGAVLQVQVSPDSGTTWITLTGASLTVDGVIQFDVNATQVRVNISGVTTTSLNAWITSWWAFAAV